MSNEEVIEFIRVRLAERMEPEIVSITMDGCVRMFFSVTVLYIRNETVEKRRL